MKNLEGSHSGRVRTLGKRVYRKVSRVQIPPPPCFQNSHFAWLFWKHFQGATQLFASRGGFERRNHVLPAGKTDEALPRPSPATAGREARANPSPSSANLQQIPP